MTSRVVEFEGAPSPANANGAAPPIDWAGDVEPRSDREIAAVHAPPRLGEILKPAYDRAVRRCNGEERPIPLPWPELNDHFGGGVWPGVHYLTKGTGIGGTQLAMQALLHAGRLGFSGLYVGLEMGAFDLGIRAIGLESDVPWSALWTGRAGPKYLQKAQGSIAALSALPVHVELARPMGYSAGEIVSAFERVRALYPGEQPIFGVVDFLQLVGNSTASEGDLRQRIGAAAYALRELSVRLNVAVLAISSIAREKIRSLADIAKVAGLTYSEDANGRPIDRRILDPDAIVGLGKESGEIEYSGDSVSVVARVPGTWDGHGCDVVFATAKGRATGPMWSPLHFTGHRYDSCEDRGGRLIDAWKSAADRKSEKSEEKKAKKEHEKAERPVDDARIIVAFIQANPACSVRSAREAVGNSHDRWTASKSVIGDALIQSKSGNGAALTIDSSILPAELRS